ncbi:MAG TPA: substrate-binding domain-containing protein [Vicinamibacteria bacterium]|nr:substrate-binding domain-containing protein [Vicinamibacteria bacterium]
MGQRRVVVSLLSEQQEFQLMQAADARAAAARAGLGIDVVFADNNAIIQIHQLFKHVHAPEAERPAAIVVETVTGEGLERVARNAVNAGIGWVLINRSVGYLEALRGERGDLPIAVVSVDNREAGRIQGRQLIALLPRGGSVLYVQGPADTAAASHRLRGVQETLEGRAIELRVLNGDWTTESGEKAVGGWLRLKTSEGFRPAVVAAQNDAMATGARRALQAHRPDWKDLAYTGCDGLPEGGQKLVRAGELTATIVTPTPAGPAVALVARALAGERIPGELTLPPRSYPPEGELASARKS